MGSKISYNIHAQAVKDSNHLLQHLQKIEPTAVLTLDGLGLAQQIKTLLPNTLVIHRNYGVTNGDDDVQKRLSPEEWLNRRAAESQSGIYLYTTNEPAFDQQCIEWHVRLMELAAGRGVRLVIGNWAVGNPGADDWGLARRMLELLDQHRDLFVLGLHEYGCAVMTSGLFGGYPDNAGVQPGTAGGQNLIQPANWPPDVTATTMFHCGRFHFLLNYCRQNNLKPPRIILTEHGMDDVSDIKPWTETLEKTAPYLNIRGWKSIRSQWNLWYGGQGWSPERSYFEQLAWADRTIYRNSPVEAQLIFCWAHSSEMWEQFDVAEAFEFQSALEAYAQQGVPTPASQPAVVQPVGVAPVGVAPVGSQPVIVQPVGVAPVGVAPVGSQSATTPPAVAVAVPAVAVPVATAAQPAANSPLVHLDVELTSAEIDVITTALRGMSAAAANPGAFNRLADALDKARK